MARRLPYVALAFFSLVVGLWAGLNRIGWALPLTPAVAHHGSIMVGGFIGTLISLEKVIPLKRRYLFVIPVISAASVVAYLSGLPLEGMLMQFGASVGMFLILAIYLGNQRNLIYLLMLVGAGAWITASALLFFERSYPAAVPWWMGFTLLIIVAERLEITQFLPVSHAQKRCLAVVALLYVAGITFGFHGIGRIVTGSSFILIAIWLLRHDVVRVTISKRGLTRYVAMALLCGYISLLLSGIFFISLEGFLAYDALVHTFFIGFVMSMIFAHGPIILPGVLGIIAKPFHPALYVWLVLLHASWIARLCGDQVISNEMRMYSGVAAALAVIGYFATMAKITFWRRG